MKQVQILKQYLGSNGLFLPSDQFKLDLLMSLVVLLQFYVFLPGFKPIQQIEFPTLYNVEMTQVIEIKNKLGTEQFYRVEVENRN